MPDNILQDILSWRTATRIILALDPDAYSKSLQLAVKWGGMFPNGLEVAQLRCDPKDYGVGLLEDLRL